MLQQTNNRLKKSSIFSAILLASVCSATALWAQQAANNRPPATQTPQEKVATTNAPAAAMKQTNDGTAYNYVDQMPKFNGNLSSWLSKHVKYPPKARKAGAQGRSIIKFVVTEDGSVGYTEVVRSAGNAELDSAAVDVVKRMPSWKPGMQNGKAVKVYYTLPLSWKLEK